MPNLNRQRTKGEIEAEITSAMTQFVRDYLGRGPRGARTFILHDMVVVRISGVLSPAEELMVKTDGGIDLLKQMRRRMIEASSENIRTIIEGALGAGMVSLHTDLSTRTGERIFVIITDKRFEEPAR
jgi:uncharacterized protein YbcI